MENKNNKRFVYRTADKKKTTYFIPIDAKQQTSKISPPSEPAQRVVIIRNAKNQSTDQEQVNLNGFDAQRTSPVMNNGVSFALF